MVLLVDISFILAILHYHDIGEPERMIALILKEYYSIILPEVYDFPTDQERSILGELMVANPPIPLLNTPLPFTHILSFKLFGTTLFLKGENQ